MHHSKGVPLKYKLVDKQTDALSWVRVLTATSLILIFLGTCFVAAWVSRIQGWNLPVFITLMISVPTYLYLIVPRILRSLPEIQDATYVTFASYEHTITVCKNNQLTSFKNSDIQSLASGSSAPYFLLTAERIAKVEIPIRLYAANFFTDIAFFGLNGFGSVTKVCYVTCEVNDGRLHFFGLDGATVTRFKTIVP